MSWTRRWVIAGLIVAAQVGVVVVLAQCWQTSNAANPPSSVSCKRDVPAVVGGKPCPVGAESCTGSVLVQAVVPASELRALPELPAPVPDTVEVAEGPPAPPAPTAPPPLPPPNLDPTPAPTPAPAPTIAPVAPPPVPEPDRPSVMPVPVAPPPADIAPPKTPAPQVAEASGSALVAPPAAPTPPATPVSPEMKPIAKSDDPPPPPAAEPPAPPEPKSTPPPTVVEIPQPTPQQIPPAPPTKPASQPKQEITCPWTLRIENVEGRAHLEARNGKEVQFRVVCSELDVQAPRGYIQAIGDVVVNGHEMHGTCKKLTINWHDEHVQLDGGVFLKCHKDGQDIEVKGEKLSFRLSVISTVRADTTSDAPVRRAVID